MIRRTLALATFYRMHTPRWAAIPTSGAGAAKHGGRFNRPGLSALYLSNDVATAVAEYQQDEGLMPPGTLVAYRVRLTEIADLTAGYSSGLWDPLWEDWSCDWRRLAIAEYVEPPSWILGDTLIEHSLKGLLFPSLKSADGVNLVVYTSHISGGDTLTAHDPNQLLPVDQSSWDKP